MTSIRRNDLSIYDSVADRWWADEVRWVRTLKNLVPGRLAWFVITHHPSLPLY